MAVITIDPSIKEGRIKPVNGVGQPPFIGRDYSAFSYLTEAAIPFSRLHDVGGAFGGSRYVDVPNIFPDFDADPYDPASYDFVFTDDLIKNIVSSGVEPFFRLGVTIENHCSTLKAYRIYPPKDPHKWAVICEHIIRHYNEGWADGFRFGIRYWEIWNEPDGGPAETKWNMMWLGTDLEFFELYDIASRHLKERFPDLKIGGYACCGVFSLTEKNGDPVRVGQRDWVLVFFDRFLSYIKKTGAPLDFFSWHSYENFHNTLEMAHYVRRRLDEEGFTDTETSCNEWNCHYELRGTMRHAAFTASMMSLMQASPIDTAMFYDARLGVSVYGGLFDPLTRKPFAAYYSFKAFGELYRRGTCVHSESDDEEVTVLAATDGNDTCALVSSVREDDAALVLKSPEAVKKVMRVTENGLEETNLPETLPANSVYLIVFG